MNIGSLYQVKKYFWLLFPTKEIMITASPWPLFSSGTAASADDDAAWYSRKYNCNVTWFSPESFVFCLEEDGTLKKFLTSEGLIGWTQVNKAWLGCFEEVKSE